MLLWRRWLIYSLISLVLVLHWHGLFQVQLIRFSGPVYNSRRIGQPWRMLNAHPALYHYLILLLMLHADKELNPNLKFCHRLMWKTTPVTLCGFVALIPFLDPPGVLSFNWSYHNTLAILLSAILGFLLQWSGALALGYVKSLVQEAYPWFNSLPLCIFVLFIWSF